MHPGAQAVIAFDGVTLLDVRGRGRLEHVDLAVSQGSVCAVLDKAGTLGHDIVSLVLGLVAPSRGTVTVDGHEPVRDPALVRRQITYVSWQAPLMGSLSVRRNLSVLLSLSGHRPVTRLEMVRALRDNDVPDRALFLPARRLSVFQRLCVWLALASLRQSAAVLLEFPNRDLSSAEGRDLVSLIERHRSEGTTVLLTTADVVFADQVADTIGLRQAGRFQVRSGSRTRGSGESRAVTDMAK